jgi:hypothetical protein
LCVISKRIKLYEQSKQVTYFIKEAKTVNIKWLRKNCIPSPGSWFTTRKLAFGGVSRDLMPHLLSLYIAMNPGWRKEQINGQTAMACWELKDIDSTEYGIVNPKGTYDVDDVCVINFGNKGTSFSITLTFAFLSGSSLIYSILNIGGNF